MLPIFIVVQAKSRRWHDSKLGWWDRDHPVEKMLTAACRCQVKGDDEAVRTTGSAHAKTRWAALALTMLPAGWGGWEFGRLAGDAMNAAFRDSAEILAAVEWRWPMCLSLCMILVCNVRVCELHSCYLRHWWSEKWHATKKAGGQDAKPDTGSKRENNPLSELKGERTAI